VPQRARNIGSGHADPQHGFGAGAPRQAARRGHRQHRNRKHRAAFSDFSRRIVTFLST